MIEIIKRGEYKPPDPKYEATCKRCNSVFRFNASDTFVTCDQRDGRMINCPVCDGVLYLSYDSSDKYATYYYEVEK